MSNNRIEYKDFFDEGLHGKLIMLRTEFEKIRQYASAMKKAYPADVNNAADIARINKARKELNETMGRHKIIQQEMLKIEKQIAQQEARSSKQYQQKENHLKRLREESNRATKAELARKKAAESLEKQRQRALQQQAKEIHKEQELIRVSQMQVRSIEDLRAKTNALIKVRDRLDLTTQQGRRKFDLYTKAVRRNSDALLKAESTAGRYHRNVGNYASSFRGMGMMGSRVAGALGISTGLYGAVMTARDLVKVNADFEQQMAKVRAITQAAGPDLKALEMNAKELGATTLFTATQIAGLQSELGKLGFSTREIIDSTEAVQNLSAATLEELSASAMVAGSTLRGFRLDASEMTRVTDTMAASFTNSALDLSNYTESMKYVAPVAKSAGVSIEYTTAMLSALADAGLKGSMAGTAVRRILSQVATTGKPVGEALRDMSKRGLDLAGAADEVGRHAQTALLVLTENMDKVERLTGVYQDSAGAAERMAAIQRGTLKSSITLLGSAWDGLLMKFEKTNGTLKQLVDNVTEFVGWISKSFGNEMVSNIEKEQSRVNGLVVEYSNANTSLERRRKILAELGKINQDIVSGLDAENVQYQKLNDNLSAYNQGVVQRIMLEKLREDEKEAASDLADTRLKHAAMIVRLNQALAKYDKEIALNPEMTLADKARAAREALDAELQQYEAAYKEWQSKNQYSITPKDQNSDAYKYTQLKLIRDEIGISTTVIEQKESEITELESKQVDFTAKIAEMKKILGLEVEKQKEGEQKLYNLQAMSLKQLQELQKVADIEKNESLQESIKKELNARRAAFDMETLLYQGMMEIKNRENEKLIARAHKAAKELGDEAVSLIIKNIDVSDIRAEEEKMLAQLDTMYRQSEISHEQYEQEKKRITEQYMAIRSQYIQENLAEELIMHAQAKQAMEQEFEVPEQENLPEDEALMIAMDKATQEKEFRLAVLRSFWEQGKIGWQEYQNQVNSINAQGAKKDTSTIQGMISIASSLLSSLTTQYSMEEQQKTEALEKRYKNGQIAEQEYKRQKEQLEKQAARKQKERQLSQAHIQGAQVILNALTVKPWWLALSQAIIAEFMVLEQIGKIKRQKFASGEVNIRGPKHSEGGIPIEIEGGESVISARATTRSPKALEMINEGKLSDRDIFFSQKLFGSRIENHVADLERLETLHKRSITEQQRTNDLLAKFRFMSRDGKQILDIDGNITRYV